MFHSGKLAKFGIHFSNKIYLIWLYYIMKTGFWDCYFLSEFK